jgi:ABC-type transport system substrate-binding protein
MDLLKRSLLQVNPKFKMIIKPMIQNDMYAMLGTGVGALVIEGTSPQVPDGATMLSFYYSSQGTFSPHTRFKDAQIEQGFTALAKTIDPQQRGKLLTQIERRATEQQLLVLLPKAVGTLVSRSNLKGVSENYNVFRNTPLFWNSLSKN